MSPLNYTCFKSPMPVLGEVGLAIDRFIMPTCTLTSHTVVAW